MWIEDTIRSQSSDGFEVSIVLLCRGAVDNTLKESLGARVHEAIKQLCVDVISMDHNIIAQNAAVGVPNVTIHVQKITFPGLL